MENLRLLCGSRGATISLLSGGCFNKKRFFVKANVQLLYCFSGTVFRLLQLDFKLHVKKRFTTASVKCWQIPDSLGPCPDTGSYPKNSFMING